MASVTVEVASLLGFLAYLVVLTVVVLCWKRSRNRSARRARHRWDSLWPVVLAAAGIGMGARGVAVTEQPLDAR